MSSLNKRKKPLKNACPEPSDASRRLVAEASTEQLLFELLKRLSEQLDALDKELAMLTEGHCDHDVEISDLLKETFGSYERRRNRRA